jgi:hypothetical protein
VRDFSAAGWFRRRWVLAALAVVLVMSVAYVGSYYHISRRGMREAKPLKMKGFLYIPVEEVTAEESMSRHYTLARFYAPANALDQVLTGAEGPVRGILFCLSK